MIQPTDQIVAAWGEYHKRSRLVFVVVRDPATGELREESIQPEELNNDMDVLLNASAAVADSMKLAVQKWQKDKKRKARMAEYEPPGEDVVTVGDLMGLKRV